MLKTDSAVQQANSSASVQLTPLSSFKGTVSIRVFHNLKDAILSLSCPLGQILRKGDVCDQLRISRSPVSEAVTRLAVGGLVDVIPQTDTSLPDFWWMKSEEGHFCARRWNLPQLRASLERSSMIRSNSSKETFGFNRLSSMTLMWRVFVHRTAKCPI